MALNDYSSLVVSIAGKYQSRIEICLQKQSIPLICIEEDLSFDAALPRCYSMHIGQHILYLKMDSTCQTNEFHPAASMAHR